MDSTIRYMFHLQHCCWHQPDAHSLHCGFFFPMLFPEFSLPPPPPTPLAFLDGSRLPLLSPWVLMFALGMGGK